MSLPQNILDTLSLIIANKDIKTVYYNHNEDVESNCHFNTGVARRYNIDDYPDVDDAPCFLIPVNTYCLLIKFNLLATIWETVNADHGGMRPFDSYEESIIPPEELEKAATLLRAFLTTFRIGESSIDIEWSWSSEGTYKIIIDLDEARKTLLDLADFLKEGSKIPSMSVEFLL